MLNEKNSGKNLNLITSASHAVIYLMCKYKQKIFLKVDST